MNLLSWNVTPCGVLGKRDCSPARRVCGTTRGEVKYTGENCIMRKIMMNILHLIWGDGGEGD
jgi:hypothetical protein